MTWSLSFDFNGNRLSTLVAQSPLNSSWGLRIAPATFGDFANELLVEQLSYSERASASATMLASPNGSS